MEKEEILINSQFALFFDQSVMKPEELWQGLNNKMDNIFDKTPIIFPVPNDLKFNEIPIVQMLSASGVYSCNISRGRADFFHAGAGKQKFMDIKKDFIDEISKLFNFFNNKTKIARIGFVNRFFIEDENQDKTISGLLKNAFIKLHTGDIHESFVRYVSRGSIDEFKINNFTAIEKFFARIAGATETSKGILITRDFNTIPEENYKEKFTAEKIKSFIEKSEEEFKLNDIKSILW